MAQADRRRVTASAAVVFIALLTGSGATVGSDADHGPFDPVAFATGIEDHFRIEYGTDAVKPDVFDPVAFATGIEDHFRIEYGSDVVKPDVFDPVAFATGIEDHFRIEYGSDVVD